MRNSDGRGCCVGFAHVYLDMKPSLLIPDTSSRPRVPCSPSPCLRLKGVYSAGKSQTQETKRRWKKVEKEKEPRPRSGIKPRAHGGKPRFLDTPEGRLGSWVVASEPKPRWVMHSAVFWSGQRTSLGGVGVFILYIPFVYGC